MDFINGFKNAVLVSLLLTSSTVGELSVKSVLHVSTEHIRPDGSLLFEYLWINSRTEVLCISELMSMIQSVVSTSNVTDLDFMGYEFHISS